MSRGLGRTQRLVLEFLREETAALKHIWEPGEPEQARRWHGLRKTARRVTGRDDLDPELYAADHSLIESVRRAIKTLEQRGLVEVAYIYGRPRYDKDDEWHEAVHGQGLHCRLSDEEYARVEPKWGSGSPVFTDKLAKC
jgi:hypothetical protein